MCKVSPQWDNSDQLLEWLKCKLKGKNNQTIPSTSGDEEEQQRLSLIVAGIEVYTILEKMTAFKC